MSARIWNDAQRRATGIFLSLSIFYLTLSAPGSAAAAQADPGSAGADGLTQATGRLTTVVSDDFAGGLHERIYLLRDTLNQRWLRLHFDGSAPPRLGQGMMLTVTGVLEGNELYLASNGVGGSSSSNTSSTSSVTSVVTGEQRTLVILANFSDIGLACSADDVRDQMFGDPSASIDGLYREVSYGETWFTGEVKGPYQLDFTEESCDYVGWADAVDASARADGVDPDAFAHKVYVMPKNGCPASGIGTLGGTPSRAWTFRCDIPDVLAHELGHNLGMSHASMPSGEYDDKSDVMGLATRKLRQLNAPHKEQMGWLSGLQRESVTASGYYDVAPLELDEQSAPAAQVLEIAKPDTSETYYLSYRRPIGFDVNLSTQLYLDQLSVHRWSGAGNTYLMAVVPDGDSFVDVFNGLSVREVAHSDQYATVYVEFDGGNANCKPAQPQLSVNPPTQSGDPGATLVYSVTLTNGDSGACAASSFVLNAVAPLEWQASLSDDVMLLAPGETGQSSLSVTSPATTTDANVDIDVNVVDQLDPTRGATGTATFTAISPDTEAPTAPTELFAAAKGKHVDLNWQASSDNVGVQGYQVLRDGLLAGITSDTSYVDADAGSVYNVVAFDAAGNLSVPSDAAVVANGGGGNGNGNGKGKQK